LRVFSQTALLRISKGAFPPYMPSAITTFDPYTPCDVKDIRLLTLQQFQKASEYSLAFLPVFPTLF